MRFVNRTLAVLLALRFARVHAISVNAALEEAGATYEGKVPAENDAICRLNFVIKTTCRRTSRCRSVYRCCDRRTRDTECQAADHLESLIKFS